MLFQQFWLRTAICFVTNICSGWMLSIAAADDLANPWQQKYSNEAAAATHVVGLWQFNSGAELEDASGHGHTLTLEGAQTVADGKFGGGLRSFPGWPVEDKRHAAVTYIIRVYRRPAHLRSICGSNQPPIFRRPATATCCAKSTCRTMTIS